MDGMFVMKWTVCALLSRYCVGTLVRDITEIIYVLFADGFRSYLATDVVEKKGSVERSLPPAPFSQSIKILMMLCGYDE